MSVGPFPRIWLCIRRLALGLALACALPSAGQAVPPPDPQPPSAAAAVDPLAGMAPQRARHIRALIERPAAACLAAGGHDLATPQKAELSRLFALIAKSPTGARLLAEAARRGVLVCLDPATDRFAYYLASLRFIALKAQQSEGRKLAFLAHELAHVPQHPAYSDNRFFPPEDLMLLRRVREAAASATATCIAWQLRRRGHPEAWLEKRRTPFGDLVAAFEAAIGEAHGPAAEQAAMRAAFDHWFEKPRRRNFYDRMTLGHLDRISRDPMGLVAPRRRLTHRFLIGIGWTAEGNFLDRPPYRMLTGGFYRRDLSPGNAQRLQSILQAAGVEAPLAGVSAAGSDG